MGGNGEFLKSQIPHPWGTKSIQTLPGKVGYSAVEAIAKLTVKNPGH